MPTLKRYIEKHPLVFFHDMNRRHLDILEAHCTERSFKAGEVIFHAGDVANSFYLIQAGEVAIEVLGHPRGDVTIQTLSAGEVLGFSWMMEPYKYRFDAVALEPTFAKVYDARLLRDVMKVDPEFGCEIMRRFNVVISQRLQASRLQILDMYGGFSLERQR